MTVDGPATEIGPALSRKGLNYACSTFTSGPIAQIAHLWKEGSVNPRNSSSRRRIFYCVCGGAHSRNGPFVRRVVELHRNIWRHRNNRHAGKSGRHGWARWRWTKRRRFGDQYRSFQQRNIHRRKWRRGWDRRIGKCLGANGGVGGMGGNAGFANAGAQGTLSIAGAVSDSATALAGSGGSGGAGGSGNGAGAGHWRCRKRRWDGHHAPGQRHEHQR